MELVRVRRLSFKVGGVHSHIIRSGWIHHGPALLVMPVKTLRRHHHWMLKHLLLLLLLRRRNVLLSWRTVWRMPPVGLGFTALLIGILPLILRTFWLARALLLGCRLRRTLWLRQSLRSEARPGCVVDCSRRGCL